MRRSRLAGSISASAAVLVLVAPVAVVAQGSPAPSLSPAPVSYVVTPSQAEGPFYPVELPADHDADLTVVEGHGSVAQGEPLIIDGRLLRSDGSPVPNATVEIWQTDHQGIYLHPADPDVERRDAGFQGFGQVTTDETGAWSVRTILPEVYGGRPRHIHAKVRIDGDEVLTTQIYFSGGDIPAVGSVVANSPEGEALVIEAVRTTAEDGAQVLTAQHIIVLP